MSLLASFERALLHMKEYTLESLASLTTRINTLEVSLSDFVYEIAGMRLIIHDLMVHVLTSSRNDSKNVQPAVAPQCLLRNRSPLLQMLRRKLASP